MSAHGSCNGCGKGFGLFKKEEACHNCGLAFCSKCVGNKVAVPKQNNEVRHVCQRCYNIITGKIKDPSAQKRDVSPPANFIRNLQVAQEKQVAAGGARRESLKNKGLTTDPVVKRHLKPEYRNLSIDDMEIAERLERLKQDHKELELGPKPLPPIQDVEERLARLKGQGDRGQSSEKASSQSVVNQPTKKLTQHEETSNLLKQVRDEVNIDRRTTGESADDVTNSTAGEVAPAAEPSKESAADDLGDVQTLIAQAASELEIDANKALDDLKKDKEIMARLEELKARKASKSDDDSAAAPATEREDSEDSEDEEVQVKALVQQALEERRLDEQLEATGGFKPPLRKEKSVTAPPPDLDMDPDELPWCCICNEDATIRCLDCDMDLYCRRCYKDGHHQLYEDDHQNIPYKKPPGSTDV